MDIFDFDIVKAEKANAMIRYRRLQNLTKLFRLGEVCFVLVFLCWISSRLPFVVKLAGEYFRLLISIIITPLFIFLLCNIIVITLLVKSGQLSGQSTAVGVNIVDNELYEELLTSAEQMISSRSGETDSVAAVPEEIVYQDKQMIFESSNTKITQNLFENRDKLASESVPDPKVFRRSYSENLKTECLEPEKKLRRSETEINRKVETPVKAVDVVDELSNEEFQRRIEGFIAKQVKFHQEEKLAIVLHTNN